MLHAYATGPANGTLSSQRRCRHEADSPRRIDISIPSPVDPATGSPSQPPPMPGWDAYSIEKHLFSHLHPVPVLVANDADAAAVGEWSAAFIGCPSLCFVAVSAGIKSGVVDGRSSGGVDGGAVDASHVRLSGKTTSPATAEDEDAWRRSASGAVDTRLRSLQQAKARHDVPRGPIDYTRVARV